VPQQLIVQSMYAFQAGPEESSEQLVSSRQSMRGPQHELYKHWEQVSVEADTALEHVVVSGVGVQDKLPVQLEHPL
jgi:hypothetical protein